MDQLVRPPLEVFCSSAPNDEPFRKKLEKHLSLLQHEGSINTWHDGLILPGTDLATAIDDHLMKASVILFLISPDFLASEHCYHVEVKRAMARHERGEAQVIPIILRPVDWRSAPFRQLPILPTGAKPITSWPNEDEAFFDVINGIRKIIGAESLSEDATREGTSQSEHSSPTNHSPQTLERSQTGLFFQCLFVQWLIGPIQNRNYSRYLVAEHQVFDVKGLRTRTAYDLELDHVFIDLCLNGMSADRAPADPLAPPESSLQGAHSIWDYLSSPILAKHHLVVLGAPGSGKTTLLKHLALTLAQPSKFSRRRRGQHTFPILLFLRDHASTIANQPGFSLTQAIQNHLPQKLQHPLPMAWMNRRLKQGDCLILLDGLDEVADSKTRQLLVHWVEKQLVAYSGNRFVLTSRPYGYRDNPLRRGPIAILNVQAFTSGQVERFVKKWSLAHEILSSRSDDSSVRSRARQRAEGLLRSLRQFPALHALTINPLLLTMILTVHCEHGTLPGKRIELYAEMCEVLLGRRQEAYDATQDLSLAQKLQVLCSLAYFLMQQGRREIEQEQAETVIAAALEPVQKEVQPADFLSLIHNTSGIFLDRGSSIYGFAHQAFQEYLAARHIKEMGLEHDLIAQVTNSWWRETIRLYCAQGDAMKVIQACLAVSPLTVDALVLAFECGEEQVKLQPQMQAELESFLETNREDDDQERRRAITEAFLTLRLHRMIHLHDETSIDTSFITCAEYQLFMDEKRAEEHYLQPDHWITCSFPKGLGKTPVLGVRRSDAQAFCEWLTNRDEEGWRYRLPHTGERSFQEGEQWNDLQAATGYWTDDERRFEWVQGEPPTDFQERLRLIRDAAAPFNDASGSSEFTGVWDALKQLALAGSNPEPIPKNFVSAWALHQAFDRFKHTGALDLDSIFNRVCDLSSALTQAESEVEASSRFRARSSFHTFFGESRFIATNNRVRKLAFLHSKTNPIAENLTRQFPMTRDVACACKRAITFATDLNNQLDHEKWRVYRPRAHDAPPPDKSGIIQLEDDLDSTLNFYIITLLLQERIAGNFPAYEGILLVKEPK